jgi:hypothetical protein
MHGGAVARAFPERVVEANWSVVLLEELGEGLVGQLLKMFSSCLAPAMSLHHLHALAGRDQAVLLSSGRRGRGFGLALSG